MDEVRAHGDSRLEAERDDEQRRHQEPPPMPVVPTSAPISNPLSASCQFTDSRRREVGADVADAMILPRNRACAPVAPPYPRSCVRTTISEMS